MCGTHLLEGRCLSKTYNSRGRKVRAVYSADFHLDRGEILGIAGESGSGKSTLLRLISGLEKPDSGTLIHDGTEYTGWGPEKTGRFLRMIFQDAKGSFDPRMTMKKSLMEGVRDTEDHRRELLRVTAEAGLEPGLLGRRPGRLSGGQCQRMAIARALLAHVPVLLCDEITSALDVTTQAQIIRLITNLRDSEDLSVIFVSHDLALISMICDRVMIIREGSVVESGQAADVISNPRDEYTRLLLESVMEI